MTRWQQVCSDALTVALDMGGAAGQKHWDDIRQKWISQKKDRPIIADLDLSGLDLRGYNLARCWIGRISFIDANLSGSNFSQSIFRECDMTSCNIRGANFYGADFNDSQNRLVNTAFDGSTNFEVEESLFPPEMDMALRDIAIAMKRRTQWVHARARSRIYVLANFLTDHGLGLWKACTAALLLIGIFAFIFYCMDIQLGGLDSILVSLRFFTGLEDYYSFKSQILSIIGIVESGMGIVFIALLISVFTSKFTRI